MVEFSVMCEPAYITNIHFLHNCFLRISPHSSEYIADIINKSLIQFVVTYQCNNCALKKVSSKECTIDICL